MGISGFFGRWNLGRLFVELELPAEIYARRPVPVRVTVRNARRFLPAFLIRVATEGETVLFPYVEAGSSVSRYVTMSFERRGPGLLSLSGLSSVYPYNFFVRGRRLAEDKAFVVFPEPKVWDLSHLGESGRRSKGDVPKERQGFDSDSHSVRDYAAGDPLKYISWKATARTGELKTRERVAESVIPVTIDLDHVPLRDVEERVSRVTYAVLHLLGKSIPVGLKTRARTLRPSLTRGHRLALLKELALYGVEGHS
jgi:uncharacterized protein (DUF58 family)